MSSPATSEMGALPGFGRVEVEASIFGESALIDRQTGRVYWECGNSNTLHESLMPKLDQFGVEHAQATFLTLLITLAFLSVLSGWMKRAIDSCYDRTATANSSLSVNTLSVLVILAENTILKLPKIENKWLVSAFVVLYFFESYHCSTRYFLSNAISSATELDAYIDKLKQQPPVVTWKVQTFHYELRRLFVVPRMMRSFFRSLKKSGTVRNLPTSTSDSAKSASQPSTTTPSPFSGLELPRKSSRHTKPIFPITRKVVTNEASATYQYASFFDKTIVGIWSRAPSDKGVPFRKISLSKVLVLSDKQSREDYFRQQSDFVTRYGREDEFAEFSTSIDVAGYRPRLLISRPLSSHNNDDNNDDNMRDYKQWLVRLSSFWAFTCLGLTVPYRIWFKRHCDFLRVTVVKETKEAKSAPDSYLRSWFPA